MANNWAICVGINSYEFNKHLECAVNDANKMSDFFQSVKFNKIYLFTDDSPPITDMSRNFPSQPTYTKFSYWLGKRFKKENNSPLSISDNLWFFFSGHGLRHRGEDYLLLSDSNAESDFIERTAIPLSEVTNYLRESGAGNIIMLIDACRDSAKGASFELQKEQGVIKISSCQPNELSYEIKPLGHGAFTFALLESLKLQGEGNCATLERLCNRLRNRVKEISLEYHKKSQIPYAAVEPETKYHLILLPDYILPNDADLALLRQDALKAELKGDLKLAETIWTRLIKFDTDEALESLYRIRDKLKQQSLSPQEQQPQHPESKSAGTTSVLPYPDPSFLQSYDFKTVTVNREGTIIKKETHTAQYFIEALPGDIALEMVAIPEGTFMMGSPEGEGYDDEKPQHQVTVSPFYMGKYPVTQAQWKAIASLPKIDIDLKPDPSNFKGDNRPVESVNWYEAVEFCARLSKLKGQDYRLPSEAEWEYACRSQKLEDAIEEWNGKYNQPFHFGETLTSEIANYDANYTYAEEAKGEYREKTVPVESFSPNAFGLFQMHGNVWEWCADTWHGNYKGAPTDGSAWTKNGNDNRSPLRGGSWIYFPNGCRSAYRSSYSRVYHSNVIGFRVVCVFGRTL